VGVSRYADPKATLNQTAYHSRPGKRFSGSGGTLDILVHELVHLHERLHNDNFRRLMDQFMPKWRLSRDVLKSEPLAHETWEY
jgi:hypothetical protein